MREILIEPTPNQCVDRWVEMYFAEKHRADVAEEALRLAFDEWTCCDSCMFSVDCKTNRTDCKKAEISKIKQQAEARLKELEDNK